MLGAVKKPFGFVQYYGGDKEMVFTPNSPNKSRLSSTTTKNHLHHHHYPLKCLDANAILMASPSLNKTNATSGDNTTRRNNSMVFGRYDEKSDTMTTTNKRGNNTNKRDDGREEDEKNTFTPEISSTTAYRRYSESK